MSACCASLRPSLGRATPGKLESARLPALRAVVVLGEARPARLPALCRHSRARRRGRSRAPRRAGAGPAIRRADQHPVHLGHDRLSQGRDAVAPQHPQQRLLHRRGDAAHAARPAVHPGAALSLLRHGAGQSRRGHARRLHGLSRRGVRPAGDAGDRRRGALHRAARRADHVHRAARSSRISPASICRRCAPASWPARRARSK